MLRGLRWATHDFLLKSDHQKHADIVKDRLGLMTRQTTSILHYGPLVETTCNNLYAPTPNGQSARVRR